MNDVSYKCTLLMGETFDCLPKNSGHRHLKCFELTEAGDFISKTDPSPTPTLYLSIPRFFSLLPDRHSPPLPCISLPPPLFTMVDWNSPAEIAKDGREYHLLSGHSKGSPIHTLQRRSIGSCTACWDCTCQYRVYFVCFLTRDRN